MKKLIYSITIVLAALAASSCQRDVIEPESVIKDSTVEMNDFDRWLEVNFLKPYNIEFKYRYALNESDMGYYTVPADVNSSVIYAHLVKYLCIDTYDEIAGVTFTRSYFPKMFFLIGTWEYRNNGSIVLGTAEAGKKIMLAGVNELPLVFQYYEGAELDDYLNTYYIKTIHHEFTHILNQTKDFPVEFTQVTPTSYVTESWNTSAYGSFYRQRGFLSTYAQHSDREDFAECLSLYVTNTDETVQGWLEAAGREVTEADVKSDEFKVSFPNLEVGQHFNGDQLILAKLAQVRKYMADTFNIDIDQLRAAVLRRQADVVAGDVDLTSLDVN